MTVLQQSETGLNHLGGKLTNAYLPAAAAKSPRMTVTRGTSVAIPAVETWKGQELQGDVTFRHHIPFYTQNCQVMQVTGPNMVGSPTGSCRSFWTFLNFAQILKGNSCT